MHGAKNAGAICACLPGFSLAKAGEMLRAEDSAQRSASQVHAPHQPQGLHDSQYL